MSTSIHGNIYNEKGERVGSFFQCKINPDYPEGEFEDLYAQAVEDHERDEFLKNHDPPIELMVAEFDVNLVTTWCISDSV